MAKQRAQRQQMHKSGRRRLLIWAIPVLVVVAIGATILLTQSTPAGTQACTPSSPTGTNPGQCAPDFTLPDLQGKHIRLASYRGSPVLLHFWGVG
jgi:cytochrome oxidase Cu insertion factor (SCO1/SenC/PrrC family)